MNGWEAVIRKKGFESSPGGMGFRHGIEAKDPRVGIQAEFFVESLLPAPTLPATAALERVVRSVRLRSY